MEGKTRKEEVEGRKKKEGKKMLKKWMLIGIVFLFMLAPVAHAGSTDNLTLTVTVTPTVDVTVYRTTYDFQTVAAGIPSMAGVSTAIKNTSTSAIQKYSIRASNAKTAGATGWTLAASGSETANQYSLSMKFNTVKLADWGDSTVHDILTSDTTCDGTVFLGDQDGYNTPAGTTENMWFRIHTPTSVSNSSAKTIWITVTAVVQG